MDHHVCYYTRSGRSSDSAYCFHDRNQGCCQERAVRIGSLYDFRNERTSRCWNKDSGLGVYDHGVVCPSCKLFEVTGIVQWIALCRHESCSWTWPPFSCFWSNSCLIASNPSDWTVYGWSSESWGSSWLGFRQDRSIDGVPNQPSPQHLESFHTDFPCCCKFKSLFRKRDGSYSTSHSRHCSWRCALIKKEGWLPWTRLGSSLGSISILDRI